MDKKVVGVKFDDVVEISATHEVLEDLLNRQYIKDNLSICDYERIKDLAKQIWYNTTVDSNGTFFYKGYEFVLVKVHSSVIVDKVICFLSDTSKDKDELMPWFSEKTDIIEADKTPPDDLIAVIDEYLDKQEETQEETYGE